MSRLALLVLLLAGSLAAQAETLRLADGRRLPILGRTLEKGNWRIDTVVGELVVPATRLELRTDDPEVEPTGQLRLSTGPLLLVESDLDGERHQQLATGLEAFARRLVDHYRLKKKDLVGAPYRVRAWRRRAGFKAAQERLAPAISRLKGRGFGEGVAGFYAPDLGEVHFWDGGSGRVGARLEQAQHEVTHLFNHLLAGALGRAAMPVWFEEGTAVYFSTAIAEEAPQAGELAEPMIHEASAMEVIGDLEADRAYGLEDLLAVPYERFQGREYSWSWALIRQLRALEKGAVWSRLLDWLATGESGGIARVVGKDLPGFERRWRQALNRERSRLLDHPLRRDERLAAVVVALEKPGPELARSLRSIARSYASVSMAPLALAFFEAAWRGGAEEAEDRVVAARLRAAAAGLAEDEPWPAESLADLRRAVVLDPLLAEARLVLAEALLAIGNDAEAAPQLALALFLAGEADDVESAALAQLRLAGDALEPERKLVAARPELGRAFARARVALLQEEGRFSELVALLEARVRAGTADFEDRVMLADFDLLLDRPRPAAQRFRALLEEDPRAHHLRPRLARALVAAGEVEAARRLAAETRSLARTEGLDLGFVIERIEAALTGR